MSLERGVITASLQSLISFYAIKQTGGGGETLSVSTFVSLFSAHSGSLSLIQIFNTFRASSPCFNEVEVKCLASPRLSWVCTNLSKKIRFWIHWFSSIREKPFRGFHDETQWNDNSLMVFLKSALVMCQLALPKFDESLKQCLRNVNCIMFKLQWTVICGNYALSTDLFMNNESVEKLRTATDGEDSCRCCMGDPCQPPSVSCHRDARQPATEKSPDQTPRSEMAESRCAAADRGGGGEGHSQT